MTPTPFVAWTDAEGRPGYLHGTKARLQVGDLLEPGRSSNFGVEKPSAFVYFTGTLDAATWGAELALGEEPGHIYIVEPTGPFEDDPNLTNQRFAGNPTQSFRSRAPLRILGELHPWQGHDPAQVEAMRAGIARLQAAGQGPLPD
jgi:rifampin ADP-ribosylating transferase